jgi:hypothetical protein
MIGGDNEQCVLPLVGGLQPFHQSPELMILVRHRLVVETTSGVEVRD